jgi:hypothetical protein
MRANQTLPERKNHYASIKQNREKKQPKKPPLSLTLKLRTLTQNNTLVRVLRDISSCLSLSLSLSLSRARATKTRTIEKESVFTRAAAEI